MSKNQETYKYYTLTDKQVSNILEDAERCMKLFADSIKTLSQQFERVEEWSKSAIPLFMEGYVSAKAVDDLLTSLRDEPDEYVLANYSSNNPGKVVLSREDLLLLNTLVAGLDTVKGSLTKLYGFTTLLN